MWKNQGATLYYYDIETDWYEGIDMERFYEDKNYFIIRLLLIQEVIDFMSVIKIFTIKFKKSFVILGIMEEGYKFLGILVITFILFGLNLGFILAVEDFQVAISNSADWEDVYSTMLFANLNDADAEFLVSTSHGSVLLNGISRSMSVLLVTSEESPFVFNYGSTIESEGFAGLEEVKVNSANLDLIEEMPEINNFIIVGNDYGYNAIAVASYAKLTNSWVFLANRANIDEIAVILSNREVNDMIIYGYVDREVKEELSQYNPDIIFTEDKFNDNVEIVKRFVEINPVKQVVLTNGDYLEKEILLGDNPVLFTGRENVPSQISDYLKGSDIEIGVLIGNELVGAATNIKRSSGINVIAKFARGARSSSAGIATVEGLDLFYLPTPRLELEVYSVRHNLAMNQLEVTYRSTSNVPAYVKGSIEIRVGGETIRVGDLEPFFIAPGDFKTIVYSDVTLTEDSDLSAYIYTLYGEVESSLDRILEGNYDIEFINIIDSCDLEIKKLSYNKQNEAFYLSVENIGDIDCWVDVELRDVMINNVKTTLGSEEEIFLSNGKTDNIEISQRMDVEDLKDNDFIEAYAYYGQKQDSLVKLAKGNFEVVILRFNSTTKVIIALIILILILIIFVLIRRRKDKDF